VFPKLYPPYASLDFYPALLPHPTIQYNFGFLSREFTKNTMKQNLEFDHTLVPHGTKTPTMNLLEKSILKQSP
jgi:hypothetical protein